MLENPKKTQISIEIANEIIIIQPSPNVSRSCIGRASIISFTSLLYIYAQDMKERTIDTK